MGSAEQVATGISPTFTNAKAESPQLLEFECLSGQEGWQEVFDNESGMRLPIFVESLQHKSGFQLSSDLLGQAMAKYQWITALLFVFQRLAIQLFKIGIWKAKAWMYQPLLGIACIAVADENHGIIKAAQQRPAAAEYPEALTPYETNVRYVQIGDGMKNQIE